MASTEANPLGRGERQTNYDGGTTVSKCPACGAISPGLPPTCPACGHNYADPGTSLPVMREQSRALNTVPVRQRLRKRPPLTRSTVVPALAGLLIAVAVVAIHFGTRTGPSTAEAPAPTLARKSPLAAGSRPAEGPGVRSFAAVELLPSLAPLEHRVLPSELSVVGGETPAGLSLLADGSRTECFSLAAAVGGPIRFSFASPLRFSHLLVHLACPGGHSFKTAPAQLRLRLDDGSERTVRVDSEPGTVWGDLAGAWSAAVTLEVAGPGAANVSVAEVEFYAFAQPDEER